MPLTKEELDNIYGYTVTNWNSSNALYLKNRFIPAVHTTMAFDVEEALEANSRGGYYTTYKTTLKVGGLRFLETTARSPKLAKEYACQSFIEVLKKIPEVNALEVIKILYGKNRESDYTQEEQHKLYVSLHDAIELEGEKCSLPYIEIESKDSVDNHEDELLQTESFVAQEDVVSIAGKDQAEVTE